MNLNLTELCLKSGNNSVTVLPLYVLGRIYSISDIILIVNTVDNLLNAA